jgi:two-component system cell cycle response regulator
VARVLVVDDSPSVRALVSDRIRQAGHAVEEAPSGEAGAERALAECPDVVVTDLVMSGISGVQLCRLLRSEPSTAHVPVILLTGSGDKRSRFWARSAGAAAYVSKDKLDDLVLMLPTLASTQPPPSLTALSGPAALPAAETRGAERAVPRRSVHERVSAILDVALFDAVVAGEVRALGSAGTMPRFFEALAGLVSDVLNYRWLALLPSRPSAPLFVHGHRSEREAIEAMARAFLGAGPDRAAHVVKDERAVRGDGTAPEEWAISFGSQPSGRLVIAPSSRGMSRDERRLLSIVAAEAGGPLEMTALYEDARRLATVDTLTGLLNRRAFLDVLDRESARSERHGYPVSLLLLDVDHFKRVNDTYGHASGDAVLQGLARVLDRVARRSDVVGRWGGEEFVVALPQTGAAGARVAAERVRRAIAEARYPIPAGEPLKMTASVGAATALPPWEREAVITAADEAMYAAKARGRNRVEFAGSGAADASPAAVTAPDPS